MFIINKFCLKIVDIMTVSLGKVLNINGFVFLFLCKFVLAQNYTDEIMQFRKQMNTEFADSAKSPLSYEDRINFKELSFFEIDTIYKVKAKLVITPFEIPFSMKTTTSRLPVYVKYAEAYFSIKGIDCKLNIYQNKDLILKKGYEDYLFLPFTDLTNGSETYGGGRYIDLKTTDNDYITIDFNKSYNPYCAYNHKYSCPIPPVENHLDLEIKAGVKAFNH